MSTSAEGANRTAAARMGLSHGQAVQEFGYDDDVDHDLRESIEEIIGEEMFDESTDEVVDVVLLWWRQEDGDLTDTVVDVLSALEDDGVLWVLTPKKGRGGHVEHSDIADAATTAGLHVTSTASAGDWTASRLTATKGARKG